MNKSDTIMKNQEHNEYWAARDSTGSLYVYKEKPTKRTRVWSDDSNWAWSIDEHSFPEIKWSDKEPTKVVIKLKEELGL